METRKSIQASGSPACTAITAVLNTLPLEDWTGFHSKLRICQRQKGKKAEEFVCERNAFAKMSRDISKENRKL